MEQEMPIFSLSWKIIKAGKGETVARVGVKKWVELPTAIHITQLVTSLGLEYVLASLCNPSHVFSSRE